MGSVLDMEWINMKKLAILGVQKEHVYIAFLLLGIFIIYVILRPVIQWILYKNAYKLLTYVISSLLLLVILLFMAFMKEGKDYTLLIKDALLTLTLFGLGLFIVNFFHFLLQRLLKKSV